MNDVFPQNITLEELREKILQILANLESGKISAEEASKLASHLDSILLEPIDIKKAN